MQTFTGRAVLAVIVRRDRVIAMAEPRARLPRLPWPIPATAMRERPATAPPPAQTEAADPPQDPRTILHGPACQRPDPTRRT